MSRIEQRTFEAWMEELDAEVQATAGVSVHDLADCTFSDWFEDGLSPSDAAGLVLANEGWE